MNKVLSLLCVILLVFTFFPTCNINAKENDDFQTLAISEYLKADINLDGTANASDLSSLKGYFLNKTLTETFEQNVADINGDDKLDILDLISFKRYLTSYVIYLSDNGNDSNSGLSADKPVKSLNKAIDLVYENGTVEIVDKYTVPSSLSWENHIKPIKISGDIFDASAVNPFKINDNVTFENCALNFKSNGNIYANGRKLVINSDVTVSGISNIYGGSTTSVASTDMTVLSGSYYYIYGGGNGANGSVAGDANLVVGGVVNNDSEYDVTNHGLTRVIVGGGFNSTVGGNTNLTIKDTAQSINIYGGGSGASSEVKGKTNVNIAGGTHMSAYGGAASGKTYDTYLTLSGGTIQQVFGGCLGTAMTGNTRVNILGGTVTRRIYGGCYNELSGSGLSYKWQSSYYVTGNTTVFLSSAANVVFDTSYADRGIFATSRYKSGFSGENAKIIYEDSAAQNEFKNSLGQKDLSSTIISGFSWTSAYDSVETLG